MCCSPWLCPARASADVHCARCSRRFGIAHQDDIVQLDGVDIDAVFAELSVVQRAWLKHLVDRGAVLSNLAWFLGTFPSPFRAWCRSMHVVASHDVIYTRVLLA